MKNVEKTPKCAMGEMFSGSYEMDRIVYEKQKRRGGGNGRAGIGWTQYLRHELEADATER